MFERIKRWLGFERPPAPVPPDRVAYEARGKDLGDPGTRRMPNPKVGDLVRHEGFLYEVTARKGDRGQHTEFKPAVRGVGKPPQREVTCNTIDLVQGSGQQEDYRDLVAEEVRLMKVRFAADDKIVAFADTQEEILTRRFSTWDQPHWYLPGRVLERHLLRRPEPGLTITLE